MTIEDTIAAIATAPGQGSIGIVRVSGPIVPAITAKLIGSIPKPGQTVRNRFLDDGGQMLDDGIAIYYRAPRSFTGEHILELHGHGGNTAPNLVLNRVLQLGARRARPGEFSERAFLNGKIDLTQAEAIADLISSASVHAARAALNSLAGVFSAKVTALAESMVNLRCFIEAALDFPDEDIDFIAESNILARLQALLADLDELTSGAQQGLLLHDGFTLAICGPPNAGKSSLLNALAGQEAAIVSNEPGTTRDIIRTVVNLDGLILHFADTAGLRQASGEVEKIGISKARMEMKKADLVLLVLEEKDAANIELWLQDLAMQGIDKDRILVILNKIDLSASPSGFLNKDRQKIRLSALTGAGLDCLHTAIRDKVGLSQKEAGHFSARSRHIEALTAAKKVLEQGIAGFQTSGAAEYLGEDLRAAHHQLGLIVGTFTTEDLLGKIFSTFCIGK